ncbi:MAG: extracellular solute-binding protein [Defluviitaleaceae bacterium]|nr:extracellular solute-binding protein [Defluviitaleaceae bacterium]
MKKMRMLSSMLGVVMAMLILASCAQAPVPVPQPAATPIPAAAVPTPPPAEPIAEAHPLDGGGTLVLSTTTSTENSGLLDYILPVFEQEYGWEVRVIAVGTGAALQIGRDGEADVLLVHARAEEDRFVAEGYAPRRYDIMYNDFIIIGPDDGPIEHNNDISATFEQIYNENLSFISRGDNSGTHIFELQVWESVGLEPHSNPNYIEVGQGMGATIGMAIEMQAYTLSDRATWLSFPNKDNFVIVCEGHEELLNPYGIMIVSSSLQVEAAQAFVDWMLSPSTQALIASFGVEEFGQPLFFPDAR